MVNMSGGYPPYQYSVDDGVTFRNSPFFTNLCSGLYSVVVTDISGNTLTNGVKLNEPTSPTTYNIKLTTSVNEVVNTPTVSTRQYSTLVTTTPTLPNGVSLTFDLFHNNLFTLSPSGNTATMDTNSILYKNTTGQTLSSSGVTTGDTNFNLVQGCQTLSLYQTGLTENWNSVTLTNSDTIVINTTTTINKNSVLTPCDVASTNDSYGISNATIAGCGCCNVIIN
jgi:hypothetical protein